MPTLQPSAPLQPLGYPSAVMPRQEGPDDGQANQPRQGLEECNPAHQQDVGIQFGPNLLVFVADVQLGERLPGVDAEGTEFFVPASDVEPAYLPGPLPCQPLVIPPVTDAHGTCAVIKHGDLALVFGHFIVHCKLTGLLQLDTKACSLLLECEHEIR